MADSVDPQFVIETHPDGTYYLNYAVSGHLSEVLDLRDAGIQNETRMVTFTIRPYDGEMTVPGVFGPLVFEGEKFVEMRSLSEGNGHVKHIYT